MFKEGFAPSCMERISASSPVKRWVPYLAMLALRAAHAPVPARAAFDRLRALRCSCCAGTGRGTGFSGPNKELEQGRGGSGTATANRQQLPGGEAERKRLGEGVQMADCGQFSTILPVSTDLFLQAPARRSCDVLDALPLGRDKEGFFLPCPFVRRTQWRSWPGVACASSLICDFRSSALRKFRIVSILQNKEFHSVKGQISSTRKEEALEVEIIKLIWHFVVHIVIGTGLFMVVGAAAVVLKLFIDQMIIFNMPEIIIDASHVVTYMIYFIDVLCFSVFLVKEAYVFCKEVAFPH